MRYLLIIAALMGFQQTAEAHNRHHQTNSHRTVVTVQWSWVPGHWNRGIWVRGHWSSPRYGVSHRSHRAGPPPRRTHAQSHWVPGHWTVRRGKRVWISGYWS